MGKGDRLAISDQFDEFLRNLRLTEIQKQDVETKRSNVGRALHAAYYGGAYDAATNFLSGSHGKQTAIRPPSDIDLMFIVPYATYEAFSRRTGNIQSQLLQQVRLTLKGTFSNTDMSADGQVVMIPFSSYRVELVPCVKLEGGRFWICDTNNGGSWKIIDPVREISTLQAADVLSNGNLRNLVRMLKCWRNNCGVPMKPFWLELLATEFLQTWQYHDKSTVYYDWMLRDFFKFLQTKKNAYIFPNTSEYISLGDSWLSRAETALIRATKGCDDFEKYPHLVCDEWKKIFGDFFPSPIAKASTLLTGATLGSLLTKGVYRG